MHAAEAEAAGKQAEFDARRTRRDWLKAQHQRLDKTAKDAETKECEEAFAEAYTIAKMPLDGIKLPPSLLDFANDLRSAWTELNNKKSTLRQKADVWSKAVRSQDDLKASIDELTAKRADTILAQVKEMLAAGKP